MQIEKAEKDIGKLAKRMHDAESSTENTPCCTDDSDNEFTTINLSA